MHNALGWHQAHTHTQADGGFHLQDRKRKYWIKAIIKTFSMLSIFANVMFCLFDGHFNQMAFRMEVDKHIRLGIVGKEMLKIISMNLLDWNAVTNVWQLYLLWLINMHSSNTCQSSFRSSPSWWSIQLWNVVIWLNWCIDSALSIDMWSLIQ